MLKSNLKVSIIVLNWNGRKWLDECIESCLNQTYKNLEIIFADNNSKDGSTLYVQRKWPAVVIAQFDDNYGFAAGNNKAINYATGDLILFLNNDTKIFPDLVEKLISAYEVNSILIPQQFVGDFSNVANANNYKIFMGNGIDLFGYPYGVLDFKNQRVFYADGAALFISKKDFTDLGMFDEKLFMFQEDIDLSWRARLRGFKLKTCPEAKLFHYSGGSAVGGAADAKRSKYIVTTFRRYHNEKNIIRNMLKNYSLLFLILLFPFLFLIHLCEFIAFLVFLKTDLALCYIKAYEWNIKNINDTFTWRRSVQSSRTVGDFDIIKEMYLRYSKLTAILRLGLPEFN